MSVPSRILAISTFICLTTIISCAAPTSADLESNKEIVRRFIAETDAQNFSEYDKLLTQDLVFHLPGGNALDRQQAEENERMFAVAFPDASRSIDQLIAEADRVVLRETFRGTHQGEFQGLPATGRKVEVTANVIYRISDGKIAEMWGEADSGVLIGQIKAGSDSPGSRGDSIQSDVISEAKGIVSSHEKFAMSGNLEGVMSNVADDIVVLAAGVPLIIGTAAFQDFYAGLMASGTQDFGHDYTGGEAIGANVVVLHGISRGTLTTNDDLISEFSNNFIHALRRTEDGKFKLWRATIAPDSPAPLTGE
jgi:steroid delta-isomerase-like uncharacterized protein